MNFFDILRIMSFLSGNGPNRVSRPYLKMQTVSVREFLATPVCTLHIFGSVLHTHPNIHFCVCTRTRTKIFFQKIQKMNMLMKFCRSHTRSWRRMWTYSWPKRRHIHWHLWFWVQKRPCAFRSSCLRSQKVFWRSHRIWWNEAKMVQDFRYALWQNVDWRWILASLLFSPTEIQILFPVWGFWQNFDPSGHSSGVTWISKGINSAFLFNANGVPFNTNTQ